VIPYLLGAFELIAWLVLPGLAIAVLAERGEARPSRSRLALFALTGGLSFWFLGSQVLMLLGGLSTVGVWFVTLAVAVGAGVVLARVGIEVIRRVTLPHLVPSVAIGLVATIVASLPVLRVVAPRDDTFIGSTPWYYWRLAQETIRAGGVPASSFEWATKLPFLDDYPAFTAASSVLAVATGNSSGLAAGRIMIVLSVMTFALAGFILARELGADLLAAGVAAVLLTAGDTIAMKLLSYRPEAAGYALMLLIPAAGIDFFRSRRVSSLILTAVAGLALSQIHGLDWVFAIAVLGALAIAALVLTRPRRQVSRAVIMLTLFVGATWFVGNAVLGGGLSGAGKLGGLPRVVAGNDPTLEFRRLVAGHLDVADTPALSQMMRDSLRPDFLGGSDGWWTIGVIAMLAALGYTAVQPGDRRRAAARLVIVVIGSLVFVLAFSYWLAFRHSTFVPRRTGFGRVLEYSFIMIPLATAIVLTAIARRRRLVALVLGIAITAAAFFPAFSAIDDERVRAASPQTLRVLRNLRLDPHALVLTNFYSEGFVPDIVGARGALDGRAPYTERDTLARANTQLRRSIEFFAQPPGTPGAQLPVPGLTHILIATGDGWALGAYVHFATEVAMLDARPDLRLVTSNASFRLYQVLH
jgi:hypothetical protein